MNAPALSLDLENPLLTPKDLAELLHVSERTVDTMIAEQQISYVKVGRLKRFRPEHVLDYLLSHQVRARRLPGAGPERLAGEDAEWLWGRIEGLIKLKLATREHKEHREEAA